MSSNKFDWPALALVLVILSTPVLAMLLIAPNAPSAPHALQMFAQRINDGQLDRALELVDASSRQNAQAYLTRRAPLPPALRAGQMDGMEFERMDAANSPGPVAVRNYRVSFVAKDGSRHQMDLNLRRNPSAQGWRIVFPEQPPAAAAPRPPARNAGSAARN